MQPRPLPPHRTAHCRSAEREARGCLAAPCARAAHPWGHFREADAHLVTHVLISGAPSPGRRAARGCSARQARSRRALRAPRTRRPGCRAAERERRQESGRANEWAGHSDLEPRAAAVQRAAGKRAGSGRAGTLIRGCALEPGVTRRLQECNRRVPVKNGE